MLDLELAGCVAGGDNSVPALAPLTSHFAWMTSAVYVGHAPSWYAEWKAQMFCKGGGTNHNKIESESQPA